MRVLTPVYLLVATALIAFIKVNWLDVFALEVLLYIMFFAQATLLILTPLAGRFEFNIPICKATIPVALIGLYISSICAFDIETVASIITISN